MTRLLTGLACGLLVLSVAGCGGGNEETTIFIQPQLDELPPDADEQATLQSIVSTLTSRAEAFAIEADVELLDDGRVSVTTGDLDEAEAHELFTRQALMSVRRPSLDAEELVICRAEDGSQVTVPPDSISYPPADSSDRARPRCEPGDGSFADIVWEPATGEFFDGQSELTPELIEDVSLDRSGSPVIVVRFVQEGNFLLNNISREILGLPLGIFLDDELLAAPVVGETIVTGNLAIAGLSLHRARVVKAQLDVEPLPVPVSEAGG